MKRTLLWFIGIKLGITAVCITIFMTWGMWGLVWRDKATVEQEIERPNGDVNIRNQAGLTALHVATHEGDTTFAKRLIKAGADLHAQTYDAAQNTPLHIAAWNGDFTGVEQMFYLLLEQGADPSYANAYGDKPLIYVLQVDNYDQRDRMLEWLIKHGADINARNNQGNTLLHIAVEFKEVSWVRRLLERYGSVLDRSVRNNDGRTAREHAQYLGYSDVVEAIDGVAPRELGATERDFLGLTGLMAAVLKGDTQRMRTLLAAGGDVQLDAVSDDAWGNTALMYGVLRDEVPVVLMLLEAGAQVNVKNKQGQTALLLVEQVKREADRVQLVHALLAAGADLRAQDAQGMTVLHKAVQRADKAVVQVVMAVDAQVADVADAQGRKPRQMVARIADAQVRQQLEALLR